MWNPSLPYKITTHAKAHEWMQGSTLILCWLSVADCQEPPELEHGFVTFLSRNNLTTYRAAIQYHCQHPYYHMAPNSTGELGEWNGWAQG